MINIKIENFLKSELKGWKIYEIIILTLILITTFVSGMVYNDNLVAVISAFCGILYTSIAGKGNVICYYFGLTGSALYAYLAFSNGLYGNVFLYLCYYIPMQILGIFQWKKHLQKTTNQIIKTNLGKKELIILSLIAVISCIAMILILMYLKDTNPYIDGITTILSIVGMYLTVKRCIEQWLVWMIVNGLSLIMWINVVLHGVKVYSMLIMWSVYFILAIYFYFLWKKELQLKK